jgi:hypothetical protein
MLWLRLRCSTRTVQYTIQYIKIKENIAEFLFLFSKLRAEHNSHEKIHTLFNFCSIDDFDMLFNVQRAQQDPNVHFFKYTISLFLYLFIYSHTKRRPKDLHIYITLLLVTTIQYRSEPEQVNLF